MLNLTSLNLLVSDLESSREFYTKVFGEGPATGSPTYAQWTLPSGVRFGLVKAGISAKAEFVFETDDPDAFPEALAKLGAQVIDSPRDRRFGRTAVLADLEGHRLCLQRAERPSLERPPFDFDRFAEDLDLRELPHPLAA